MNRSEYIYHIIAIVSLALIIFLLWNFSSDESQVAGEMTANLDVETTPLLLYGHLYRMIPVFCVVVFLSIVIAFYLEEWLPQRTWQYRLIERYVVILARVPSLVYGIFAVYFIVFHSQHVLNYTLLLTTILLVMPIFIRSTQNAIQDVDISVREAAYALGATKWRVVSDHVFPHTVPAILAAIGIAISRILATAALLISGVCIYTSNSFDVPNSVFVLISGSVIVVVFSCLLDCKK